MGTRHNPQRTQRPKSGKLPWYMLILEGMTQRGATHTTVSFQARDDEDAKKKVPGEICSLKINEVLSKKLVREIPL